jgi:hypothetical protein
MLKRGGSDMMSDIPMSEKVIDLDIRVSIERRKRLDEVLKLINEGKIKKASDLDALGEGYQDILCLFYDCLDCPLPEKCPREQLCWYSLSMCPYCIRFSLCLKEGVIKRDEKDNLVWGDQT